MDQPAFLQVDRALSVLFLEDSALDAELVMETLTDALPGVRIEHAAAADEFAKALHGCRWDLILADYRLPAFDGLSALAMAREYCPDTPFIFVSGALGEEVAVDALKRGATDYVLKDRLERLPGTVLRALAEARERDEKRRAQDALERLLEERTALLHELDHRVKNNLQLLSSLIGIEIRQAETESLRRGLGRMKERLQALAAAHLDLYDGRGSARFDATAFARHLCEELTARRPGVTLEIDCRGGAVEVEAAKAAPIALLFNEIVVNALTHVYDERHGKLKVALRMQDLRLLFQLSDDRFSPEEKRAARDAASGTILNALARQLDAVLEWPQDDPALLVRVTLPVREIG